MDDDFNQTTVLPDYIKELARAARELQQIYSVSKYAAPIVIGLLLTIGLFGNFLVVYVSMTTKRIVKHPVHSLLVLNLAIADLIYLMASAPYQISANVSPRWIYGAFLCPAFHFLNIQTMSVGIFTMCALAIMRFLALRIPFKIKKSFITTSGNKAGIMVIIVVWILGSVLAAPNLHFVRLLLNNPEGSREEVYECVWEGNGTSSYSITLLVVTYILPFLLVLVLYFFIVKILCQMGKIDILHRKLSVKRQSANSLSSCDHPSERVEYLRTTYMIFCLIGAFLICWFPYQLFKVMKVFGQFTKLKYATMFAIMEVVGYCMSYAHACVNPIIYTFAAPGFRKTIGEVCNKKRLKKKFRIPQFSSQRWNKSPHTTPRRFSHETTRMITLTNHDPACNLKFSPSANDPKTPNESTVMS